MKFKPKRLGALAENFKELCAEHKDQKSFADFLGISPAVVSNYIKGERIPDAEMLAMICRKCKCSADWLLGLSSVRVPDIDIKAICAKTGLDFTSVLVIQELKDGNPTALSALNYALSNEAFTGVINLAEMFPSNNEGEDNPRYITRWTNENAVSGVLHHLGMCFNEHALTERQKIIEEATRIVVGEEQRRYVPTIIKDDEENVICDQTEAVERITNVLASVALRSFNASQITFNSLTAEIHRFLADIEDEMHKRFNIN